MRSEGSRRENSEHSESEPVLAYQVGNLAKYGKAQKLDNLISWDGWLRIQASRLNWGSPVPSHDDE
ncbi:MAG TPA: hypothetical protein GX691_04350 [Clostridia bacterium]|nr:hypothetical protein [Clostridia bacterium]